MQASDPRSDSNEPAAPPILGQSNPVDFAPGIPRWRWMIHLGILTLFPLMFVLHGYLQKNLPSSPMLPKNVSGLLLVSFFEIFLFALILGLACFASKATRQQLMLNWHGGPRPVWLGLLYSIGLRIAIAILLFVAAALWIAFRGTKAADLNALRPNVEQVINPAALASNPLYLVLLLTLVSFVVAGLREEIWRAGMLAGMNGVFPRLSTSMPGKIFSVFVVAVLFGLAHLVQGWSGVFLTALLGFGLGMIMIWHRSVWEAVLAHGFFDAGSFAMLYTLVKIRHDLF